MKKTYVFAEDFVDVLGNIEKARMSRKWGMILTSDQKKKKGGFFWGVFCLSRNLVFKKSDSQSDL